MRDAGRDAGSMEVWHFAVVVMVTASSDAALKLNTSFVLFVLRKLLLLQEGLRLQINTLIN